MACYLVISSRHLSNGHYRGIKGIFRGPLCKNGDASPDFAEKEKAAARALEDVKANFYCELCDKQYHKHHEFDNHINSYDHAHKQRLKELKQREFARNVASKSWKDEKKQEKALKRLHQLAELRKQSECVAGCGPLVNTPQVITEKQQQPQEKSLLVEESNTKNRAEGQNLPSSTPEKQQEVLPSKNQSCIERHHLPRNRTSPVFSCGTNSCNRAGVSFSFSKKVHLKLESSASVFSENMEDAYDCIRSPRHKAKQAPKECHGCIHMSDERRTNLQKRLNALQGHPGSIASCSLFGKRKMQKAHDQNTGREQVETHLSSCNENLHLLDLEYVGSPNVKEQERLQNETQKCLETVITSHLPTNNVCMQENTYKHSDVLFAEHVPESSGQLTSKQRHPCEVNYNPCAFKQSPDCSKTVGANGETPRSDSLVHEIKPKALPFLHVLSKDGSTALRWPTELLLFTKTEPSISYGCNPLYFDFRLSLSHRDSEHNEINMEGPKECFKNMDIDEIEASGLTELQLLSNEPDNQSLKPKKKKRAVSLNKSQPKLEPDTENEMNQCVSKYISDDSNESIPEVPAHLNCSQRHCTRATSPHTTMHVRSLAQHLQNFEQTLQEEVTQNICIYPLVASRTEKQTCAKCDLIYSQRQNNLNLVTCPSDINDSRNDSILGYTFGSTGECLEKEDDGSFAGCWKFSHLQKPFSDRQSNYSDTSASSVTSCYSSHRSSDHSRSHLPFCYKRKQKPVERQKCKHKKHNCISSSDDADEDCHFNKKSQRVRNCTQRHTVKYQRHSRYRHLLQRDTSKPTRNRHPLCKHSRGRSYSKGSKGSSIQDSGSSERSSSGTRSRGSSSGSLTKGSMHSWSEHKRDVKSNDCAEPGKSNSVHLDCRYLRCPSKHIGICSISHFEREALGQRKSLTAKLLLEKVNSKRNQEQTQNTENFSNTCEIGLPHSQPGVKSTSLMAGEVMFFSPEKALSTTAIESNSEDNNQVDISAIDSVTLTANAAYGNCLLKDLIQRGTGFQTPNMEKGAAIKEQSNVLPGEMQSLLPSCDAVPNDFSGAFPSHTYSVVANLTETKEEHNANVNLNGEGSNLNCYSDSAMHKSSETESSKCISFPLTQQPITFSPDEIDKYKFLQLQAQQHMQKQRLARHLKVLPAAGPTAFSTSPAVQPIPIQQQSSVSTLHHTLLQSFALSTGVHPHGSHLSLAHIHPFSQAQFAPISLSPFTPAFMPAHSGLLAGHPFHLVSATPIHPSHLMFPPLPHAAFIPTLFAPQLNAAASSAIHLNPLIHPLFQSQEIHRRS
ncbi:zinc finger protein 804B isoform X1 [Anolis carolinensis]|uniref:zinc finger protein 804B isoform X1 n=1 Tax=Anolis carolinensis TaxID=28377 RepID=UPI0004628BFD|nr:PREDICTED: zinc finger protein 804B isoform X1 [Anolis carolinensis]|eukprot:XP_008110698.1 PREDICTED: zinc finger protein 804B isoform X1 [Anolis carolinensis]